MSVTKLTDPFRNFANTSRSVQFVTLCADFTHLTEEEKWRGKGQIIA